MGWKAAFEATLMIAPRRRATMSGRKARVSSVRARTFRSTIARTTSSGCRWNRLVWPSPALFTSRSAEEPLRGARRREILSHHGRVRFPSQVGGQTLQAVPPAGHQDQFLSPRTQGAGEGGADPARGSGDEGPELFAHPATAPRSALAEPLTTGRTGSRATSFCGWRQLSARATCCTQLTVQ